MGWKMGCTTSPTMSRRVFTVHHPLVCVCGADLTFPGAVQVHVSCAGEEFDVLSHVTSDGELVDTEDGLVANGYHAGSWCSECGELLDELHYH